MNRENIQVEVDGVVIEIEKRDGKFVKPQALNQFRGFGSALKPAWEPIVVAMKPLDGTFANNALVHGVAGLNIDGCRIESEPELAKNWQRSQSQSAKEGRNAMNGGLDTIDLRSYTPQGRWPSNVLLDEESAALLDQMSGTLTSGKPNGAKRNVSGLFLAHANGAELTGYGDTGGASRFFYVSKASKRDRDEGLEGMPLGELKGFNASPRENHGEVRDTNYYRNHHPTVKPTQLMRYLVRLVTPPGGTVLDPFAGSGSTGKAAKLEGFNFTGIELDAEYLAIAQRRIDAVQPEQAQLPMPFVTEAAG